MDYVGKNIKIISVFLLNAGIVPFAHAISQNEIDAEFVKQNYEEVLSFYNSVSPSTSQQKQQLALSYFYIHDYDSALPLLQTFVKSNDADPEVLLALAQIQFEKTEYATALDLVNSIQSKHPELQIRTSLQRAKIHKQMGHLNLAEETLAGVETDDAYFQQKVSLELAEVLLKKGDVTAAKSVLLKGVAYDDESFSVGKLRYQLSRLTAQKSKKLFDAQLSFRTEYDSNVNLNPDDYLVANYTRQSDMRTSFVGDVFQTTRIYQDWDLFSEIHFYQNLYQDLSEYNETAFNLSLSPVYTNPEFVLRLPVEIDQNLKQGEVYSRTISTSPGISLHNEQQIWTHIYARVSSMDYELDVESYENPDSQYTGGGVLVLMPLPANSTSLRFLFETGKHQATGSNWDRTEYVLLLTLSTKLLPRINGDLSYQYQTAEFDSLHRPDLEERTDESHWASLKLTWSPKARWDLFGQLAYVDQGSSLPLYDYRREAAAIGVSWRY